MSDRCYLCERKVWNCQCARLGEPENRPYECDWCETTVSRPCLNDPCHAKPIAVGDGGDAEWNAEDTR